MHSTYRQCLLAGVLICFTVFAYIPAMQNGYVWDDDAHITKNSLLKNAEGLWQFWTDPKSVPARQVYPLTFTTFWIEYQIWGENPSGYHIVNVIIHCLSALLIWRILSELNIPGAWMAASLFALHPVHVESVAWITERKNVLSGFLYFTAFLLFLKFSERKLKRHYWGSLVSYIFSMTAKTTSCSLPVALWITMWWKNGRLKWEDIKLGLPFLLVGIPMGLLTAWQEKHYVGAVGGFWDLSFWERLLIASRAWWFYQGKLLWPEQLTFIYPRWEINVTSPGQWMFVLSMLITVGACWILRKRIGRGPIAGYAFFSVTIFPALGFFNIYPMRFSFVADHFQYLASLGIIVMIIGISSYLLSHYTAKRTAYILSFLILVILTGLTWRQGSDYKNLQTLWENTLKKNPDVYIAHNDLGVIYFKQGDIDRAIQKFKHAIKLCPGYKDSHYNLGVAYGEKGLMSEAYYEMGLSKRLPGGRC